MNKKTLILALSAVLLIAIAFFYFSKNKNVDEEQDSHVDVAKISQETHDKASTTENAQISSSPSQLSINTNQNTNQIQNKEQNEMSKDGQRKLLNENEFLALTDKAIKELPLTKNAQAILKKVHSEADKEDHHHSPEYEKMNIAAGNLLGDVKQAMADNPKLKPQAIKFYKECALQKEFFPHVRGLCVYNLRQLIGREEVEKLNIEYAVTSIADKLE